MERVSFLLLVGPHSCSNLPLDEDSEPTKMEDIGHACLLGLQNFGQSKVTCRRVVALLQKKTSPVWARTSSNSKQSATKFFFLHTNFITLFARRFIILFARRFMLTIRFLLENMNIM